MQLKASSALGLGTSLHHFGDGFRSGLGFVLAMQLGGWYLVVGSFFYVMVWHTSGVLSPLKVGVSSFL
jgi:hypothetical protein